MPNYLRTNFALNKITKHISWKLNFITYFYVTKFCNEKERRNKKAQNIKE